MQGSEPLHMLWQIPQYLALVVGEVMFVVTSMDFFYTQVTKSDQITLYPGLGLQYYFIIKLGPREHENYNQSCLCNSWIIRERHYCNSCQSKTSGAGIYLKIIYCILITFKSMYFSARGS